MRERAVLVLGVRVDEHAVPLAERAPPGVLTGEPHRRALEHERSERECLGQRPVDDTRVELGAPGLEDPLELGAHRKVVGPADQGLHNPVEHLAGHAGRR